MQLPSFGDWLNIRNQLTAVARPDSRFDLDLESYIPAFEGIAAASVKAIADPVFDAAKIIFVTPDNSMQPLRREALARGKTLLVPSYGLRRGLLSVGPLTVPPNLALYASWGDGIQYFAEPIPFEKVGSVGRIDLVLAGAAAVSLNGLRFGMGHRYLDVEWNIFRTAGVVDNTTPIWTMVHDCQVLGREAAPCGDSVMVDRIVTPTRELRTVAADRPELVFESTLKGLFGNAILDTPLDQFLRVAPQ